MNNAESEAVAALAREPSSAPTAGYDTRLARRRQMLLLVAVVAAGLLLWLAMGLGHGLAQAPFHVIIDGEEVFSGSLLSHANPAEQVVSVLALGAGLLLLAVLVPMVALVAIGAVILVVMLALVLGIGLPLLVVFGVLALLLSPFLLMGWIVWRLARSGASPATAAQSLPQ